VYMLNTWKDSSPKHLLCVQSNVNLLTHPAQIAMHTKLCGHRHIHTVCNMKKGLLASYLLYHSYKLLSSRAMTASVECMHQTAQTILGDYYLQTSIESLHSDIRQLHYKCLPNIIINIQRQNISTEYTIQTQTHSVLTITLQVKPRLLSSCCLLI